MATTKIGTQREIMQLAFDRLGGIDKLISWALAEDKYGNTPNYGDFLKLFVKLVPPIKPDKDSTSDTQEGFIMGLIKADNILKLTTGQPQTLIDVDMIPNKEDKQ